MFGGEGGGGWSYQSPAPPASPRGLILMRIRAALAAGGPGSTTRYVPGRYLADGHYCLRSAACSVGSLYYSLSADGVDQDHDQDQDPCFSFGAQSQTRSIHSTQTLLHTSLPCLQPHVTHHGAVVLVCTFPPRSQLSPCHGRFSLFQNQTLSPINVIGPVFLGLPMRT